jgi:hypothetical protein
MFVCVYGSSQKQRVRGGRIENIQYLFNRLSAESDSLRYWSFAL